MRIIGLPFAVWPLMVAWADISFLGTPSKGMGGAGLAVLRNPAAQAYLNPAAIAYVRGVHLSTGSYDIGTQGASIDDVFDALQLRQGSPISIGEGAALLRRFADEDTRLMLLGDLGLMVNGIGVSAGGVIEARLLPNGPLRNWARTSGDPNEIPDDARGDIIAMAGVSLPDITAGVRLPLQGSELAVGARVRILRVFYTHYFAEAKALRKGNEAGRAPELGERDFLERHASGVDLGLIWKPDSAISYTLAAVVENAIEPNVRFNATDRNGDAVQLRPLRRVVHVGAATQLETGTLFALDIIDIGNRTGRSDLRFGVEQPLGPVRISTGYASRTGWTAGLNLGGFCFAYSREFPLTVSRTLAF